MYIRNNRYNPYMHRNNHPNSYMYRNNINSQLKNNTDVKERLMSLKENLTKELDGVQRSNLDPKIKEFKTNSINKKLKDVGKALEPFNEKSKTNSSKTKKGQEKLTREELLEQLCNSDPRMLFKNPWLAKKLSNEDFEGIKMPNNLKAKFRERPSQAISRRRFTYNNPYLRGIY